MARTDTIVETLLRMERTAVAIHGEVKGSASRMQSIQLRLCDLAAEVKAVGVRLHAFDAKLNRQEKRIDAISILMARMPTLSKLILAQTALFGVVVALAGLIYGLKGLFS